jgi:hypothetical protein
MRPARVLIAVIALALIGLLAPGSAQAGPDDNANARAQERAAVNSANRGGSEYKGGSEYRGGSEYKTTTEARSGSEYRAARAPKITVRIVKRNGGQLWLVGGVEPKKGPVYVQKATSCNQQKGTCNFKFYKKIYLKNGRYETRVYAPKKGAWAWRTKVKTSYSKIWVTCKLRSGQRECPVP